MEECAKPAELNLDTESDVTSSTKYHDYDILIHPVADLPLPYGIEEKDNEIIFLDPSIGEGKRLINDKSTTVSQLFALMRQFIAPVCNNIGIIVDEILRRGASVNDVDSTTGMSMLHYVARAAALSERHSLAVMKRLLNQGADPRQRCLYSDMNALHIAAYFDISSVAQLLLKTCDLWPTVEVDSLCDSFEFGTSLHIAASCLSCKTVEVLLQNGANCNARDELERSAEDCIPTRFDSANEKIKANHVKEMLYRYKDSPRSSRKPSPANEPRKPRFHLGARVSFASDPHDPDKPLLTGTLRYVGKLPSSTDDWAGIELDVPEGKNNGNLGKRFYFQCKKDHGVFVPLSRVTQTSDVRKGDKKRSSVKRLKSSSSRCEVKVGDRVTVAGTLRGTVRFVGNTEFASGTWCGVELDNEGPGRNSGSVGGISYFSCPRDKGVFAPPSKLSLHGGNDSPVNQEASIGYNPSSSSEASPRRQDSEYNTHRVVPSDASSSSPTLIEATSVSPNKEKERASSVCINSESTRNVKKPTTYLHHGMRVELSGTNQKAVIKFFGQTDFASGLWIGLDLGMPQGRNDGSVKGKRYFSCAPKHGVMVRPSRVSYNGASGTTLLPPHLSAAV